MSIMSSPTEPSNIHGVCKFQFSKRFALIGIESNLIFIVWLGRVQSVMWESFCLHLQLTTLVAKTVKKFLPLIQARQDPSSLQNSNHTKWISIKRFWGGKILCTSHLGSLHHLFLELRAVIAWGQEIRGRIPGRNRSTCLCMPGSAIGVIETSPHTYVHGRLIAFPWNLYSSHVMSKMVGSVPLGKASLAQGLCDFHGCL